MAQLKKDFWEPLPRAAGLGTGRGGAARDWEVAGWAGRPQMWADQEQLRCPWNQRGPLCPLSAFSYKLVVLVTVSRLWLGITYYTSSGISGVQQDPHPHPQMDYSGIWGQGGAGPGLAHLP